MVSAPSDGYDDDSVVPKKRLASLLDNFHESLDTIQKIFQQSLPTQFEAGGGKEEWIAQLQVTAGEVGSDYVFLVEKLLKDYEEFRQEPDQERLDQLFSDVKSLQLLLVG